MRPTNLPKSVRTGGLALAALVLSGAGVFYLLDDGSTPASRIELSAAKRGTVTVAVSAAGNTVDGGTRELAFSGSGKVTRVYAKAGDKVGKGDVLARIDSTLAREHHTAAKAQLAAAQEAADEASEASDDSGGSTDSPSDSGGGSDGTATAQPRPSQQSDCTPTNTTTPSVRPTASSSPGKPVAATPTPRPTSSPTPDTRISVKGAGAARDAGGPRTTPGQPAVAAPLGGVAPAGFVSVSDRRTVTTTAPGSGLGASPGSAVTPTPSPSATPAMTPTAGPTVTPTPVPTDSEPAPTVTVTVTATVTATVTVTAVPTAGSPERPNANPSAIQEPADTTPAATATARPAPTSSRTATPRATACAGQDKEGTGNTGTRGTTGTDSTGNTGTRSPAGKDSTGGGTGTGGGTSGADTSGGGGTSGGGQRALSVEQAEAQVKRAEAELTDAKEELAGVRIIAPKDGTVLSVAGAVGDSAGTGAFLTLGDLDELQVAALFTESDIGKLKLGQRATITLATQEGEKHSGTVAHIAPTATTSGRLVRYSVTVAFDEPPKNLLVSQTATIIVTVDKSEETLYVPAQAVRVGADGSSVVTVQDGRQRVVTPGVRSDQYVEITEGLSENDQVILPSVTTGEFPDGNWPGSGSPASQGSS